MKNNFVISLMGPTASGKTNLAMHLYDQLNAEIISVDSAMIYKGMDIGTAKPTLSELKAYPHHLIDIVDPSETFSVSDFLKAIKPIIDQCHRNGKIPILVGGTMMYFNAFMHGLTELPQASDVIREQLVNEINKHGLTYLHQKLSEVDPVSAKTIKPTDPQRIIRALEVYQLTNQPMSQLWLSAKTHALSSQYTIIQLALLPDDRSLLHQLIAKRFQNMIELGFIDEVKQLFQREDLNDLLPSIRSVGYRQMWAHLTGKLSYSEAIEKSIIATRQLAKRQITWLRHWQSDFFVQNPFDVQLNSKVMNYLGEKIVI
ncbi:tRNA (adenosine(37)-N6)-dimethylallyltransferase MiaA [Thiotrichales bacterium 19S3-7]|nr:tRNA (adenosine(37)-N6)-dimethylallyltransferase MiaA [Thiotrichales bacterium 19S3-7]MCF6801902.1 tRNA (adenosine(37)-N6)-dimethylallyltransferase MiaA [Thiotrichales bacterium 19S3-11]